jgi:hypothetical protein
MSSTAGGAIFWPRGRKRVTRAHTVSVAGRLGRVIVLWHSTTPPALSLDAAAGERTPGDGYGRPLRRAHGSQAVAVSKRDGDAPLRPLSEP